MPRLWLAVALLATVVTTGAWAGVRTDQVTVQAAGRVEVRANVMHMWGDVEARRSSADDARQATLAAGHRLATMLYALGVAAELGAVGVERAEGRTTYRGSEHVTATVRDLSQADAAIAVMTSTGRLGGVTFDVQDSSAQFSAASKIARLAARTKAERYAREHGRTLGRLVSAQEWAVDAIPSHIIPATEIAKAGGHVEPVNGVARVTVRLVYALT